MTHDMVNSRLEPTYYILRALSPFDLKPRIAKLPLPDHVVVILIFLRCDPLTFLCSPTYFVQAGEMFNGNTHIHKLLNRLLAAFKCRCVDFIEWNVAVFIKKSRGLSAPFLVEISIHTASLDNILQVVVGLPMPDQIDFFDAQF